MLRAGVGRQRGVTAACGLSFCGGLGGRRGGGGESGRGHHPAEEPTAVVRGICHESHFDGTRPSGIAYLVQTMHNWDQGMTNESPQLLPGTLYMLILKTLAAGPMHGYAISRRIKQCSDEVLAVEEGSLYPALNRMLIKGWLEAKWGTTETGRKARFYRLTEDGRKQLKSEASEFNKLVQAIQMVMKTA
jgi:transcriptional regulator